MTAPNAGANIGVMGGISQTPDGKHVPMLTVAIPGVMNFSFIVPIDGVDGLVEGLPKMLADLKKQAVRANMGLVVGPDAAKLLEGIKHNDRQG